jgi:hypothetical protein
MINQLNLARDQPADLAVQGGVEKAVYAVLGGMVAEVQRCRILPLREILI